ncbi:MAG: BrnA antitoxin family protein [Coriobacteriia bacterium]|nr:BrnA antitoxin family protein [Coriobacteriia bacterium]
MKGREETEYKAVFDEDGYTDAPPEIEKELDHILKYGRDVTHLFPPERLVLKKEKKKITIMIDQDIIAFFKQAAKENGVKYQTMINNQLRNYMETVSNNKRH